MNDVIKFSAEIQNLSQMLRWIRERLRKISLSSSEKNKFEVACEEILVNIIHYGYENSIGLIEMNWIERESFLYLVFKDFGKPFNPLKNEKPLIKSLSVESKDIGGLGIFFLKNLVDKVEYSYDNGTNILTITKKVGLNKNIQRKGS